MIRHILVPVDDAELSFRAIAVAGAVARLTGATVGLLSVEAVGPQRSLVQERLDQAIRLVPPGVAISTTVVASTDSVATTLAHLDRSPGTILCLATHGRGTWGSLGLGQVTADLVAGSDMAVLVVGPRCASQRPADLQGSVVAAVAGDERDDGVVATAVRWAGIAGSPLVVTTTVTRPSDPGAWSDAHDVLTDAAGVASGLGMKAELLPVAAGDAEKGVLRTIDHETGCVVMGSSRRGRLGRLLFGSTTAGVVQHAPCPVLVAAPPTASETATPPGSDAAATAGG